MKKTVLATMIFVLMIAGTGFATPTQSGSQFAPTPPNPLFLPLMISGRGSFSVQGKVMDSSNQPVAGVTIVDNSGQKTITDSSGKYTLTGLAAGKHALAPEKSGLVFSPSVISVDPLGKTDNLNFQAVQACSDLALNGSFETDSAWDLPVTVFPAAYSTAAAHTGTRSVRIGITEASKNVYSFSSARQIIAIPADTQSATLRVWLYPQSSEPATTPIPEMPIQSTNIDAATVSNDAQYVLVLNPADGSLLQTLLWTRSNAQQWTTYEFNLTQYRGQQIMIHLGVFNDGLGGVTSMYADDVSLEACPTDGTPVPPPTPTCANYLGNSGFEFAGTWGIPITPYPAGYSTARANSGAQSMRTGIVIPTSNVFSYSDAFQKVTIPSTATSAKLSMAVFPITTQVGKSLSPSLSAGEKFGEQVLAGDVQYILVLDSSGFIVDTLLWQRTDAAAWSLVTFDLLKFKGQSIRIQFGTYNDGADGITAMYVDDAILDICTGAPPPPPPPPPPGTCTEKLLNNSFEADANWVAPITEFTAGYSTARAHTGARSMRTGIEFSAHNRFSYSDAYQVVNIPATAKSATLTLWEYSNSGEASALDLPEIPTASLLQPAALASDVQYVLVLDFFGNWIGTALWQRSNAQAWTQHTFDLTKFKGMYLRIQFGTYNDGKNGVTSMFVDDASLQVCQ